MRFLPLLLSSLLLDNIRQVTTYVNFKFFIFSKIMRLFLPYRLNQKFMAKHLVGSPVSFNFLPPIWQVHRGVLVDRKKDMLTQG